MGLLGTGEFARLSRLSPKAVIGEVLFGWVLEQHRTPNGGARMIFNPLTGDPRPVTARTSTSPLRCAAG